MPHPPHEENTAPDDLKPGLYLVAVPIGNLRDISLRALDVLRAADIVLCEDTRVTRKLLAAYNLGGKKLAVYNDHSDDAARDKILAMPGKGRRVALVSDAGMPLVSDPGYKLVRACAAQGIYVSSVPGASAPLMALQLSGLPADKFCFLGFLPPRSGARKKMLQIWADVPASLILFETAPRLEEALADMAEVLGGEREIAVARELTKLFEEVRRGPAAALVQHYQEHGAPKGEIVLVIAPPGKREWTDAEIERKLRTALKTMKTKDAAARVAEETGLPRKDMYAMALKLTKQDF